MNKPNANSEAPMTSGDGRKRLAALIVTGGRLALRRAALPVVVLVCCVAVGTVVIWLLCVESEPRVTASSADSQTLLATTRQVLRQAGVVVQGGHAVRNVSLTADDLSAVTTFALMRKHWPGTARAEFLGNRLVLRASLQLGETRYLNLGMTFEDRQPVAQVVGMEIGRLHLPGALVRAGLRIGEWVTPIGRYGRATEPLLREVRIVDQRLRVSVNWDQQAISGVRELVADMADKERLMVYRERLIAVVQAGNSRRFVALGPLLHVLLALANDRSEADDADPTAENRAVILLLAAFSNGRDISPAPGAAAALPFREVLLNRRADTAQHFLTSAALAISGHRALADVVGLAKEINDTHSGSGFSFTDLAADRAGARFGKMAVLSAADARRVQRIIAGNPSETVYMPAITDLPENLGPAAFGSRFKNIESPEFQTLRQEIERRIDACLLFRPQAEPLP